jgi:DNA repair protein RadD
MIAYEQGLASMLRTYQQKLKDMVYSLWNAGNRNVLAVSPTGSGKTRTMQSIIADCTGMTMSIAHRRELVGQISLALAAVGCYHRIIAPEKTVKLIIALHVREFGRSFVHPSANHMVASVQTIMARLDQPELLKLILQCQLWNMDEAHHIQDLNLWGRCTAEFKNAWGAGYTAFAGRGDRRALGRKTEERPNGNGIFDAMAIGPSIEELIDLGFLVPCVIYGPPLSSIDTTGVPITASGDYSQDKLSKAARKSTIVGDVVQHYHRFAAGKICATFCVDVGIAEDTTAAYLASGVPTALITDKTPDDVRFDIMADIRCGLLKQVVNVAILGEGVDIPVLEGVVLGKPTESEQDYRQMVGRVMRPHPGKTHGIIIDSVRNVERHGPPHRPPNHSLDAPGKRARGALRDPDEVPIRTCPACWRTSESWSYTCAHCGHTPPPMLHSRPEQVEGDLILYTPDLIDRLYGAANAVMGPPRLPISAGPAAVAGARTMHHDRADAQASLRDAMAWWAGVQRDVYGRSDTESRIRFYRKFGVCVATAQGLGATPAIKLNDLIWEDIGHDVDRNQLR